MLKNFIKIFFLMSLGISTIVFAAIPAAPQLSAKSYILMDYSTGEILASQNPHERLAPASLTKLMTAYIAEKEIAAGNMKLDDKVMISEKAWRTGGSRMFVEVNTQVSVEDLMRGIIIQSGNDASIALAEHIAGSEEAFAEMMNNEAAALGMKDTHFVNAAGLPDENQYSSAYDLALLARAIVSEASNTFPMYKEQWFEYNDIKQPNRNRLLTWDSSVDGLKTGHTDDAGYCLVASAKKEDMRLISVVMGAPSSKVRAEESKQLLTYGFRFYESKEIFAANTQLAEQPVWKGKEDKVVLGITEPLVIMLPRGKYEQLETVVTMENTIIAPVTQGQKLGTVQIKSGDAVLVERPLAALNVVEEGSWFKRFWDSIRLFFHGMFG